MKLLVHRDEAEELIALKKRELEKLYKKEEAFTSYLIPLDYSGEVELEYDFQETRNEIALLLSEIREIEEKVKKYDANTMLDDVNVSVGEAVTFAEQLYNEIKRLDSYKEKYEGVMKMVLPVYSIKDLQMEIDAMQDALDAINDMIDAAYEKFPIVLE